MQIHTVVISPVEWFGGEPEADLQAEADVGRFIVNTTRDVRIHGERFRVDLSLNPDDRPRPQNSHSITGERTYMKTTTTTTTTTTTNKCQKVKVRIALYGLEKHHKAAERHLSYGITQSYLPPNTGERAPH